MDNTQKLFEAAKKARIGKIVHISIINVSEASPFEYLRELAYRIASRVGEQGSVAGVDFCEEMLDVARRKLPPQLKNVSFPLSDAKRRGILLPRIDPAQKTLVPALLSFLCFHHYAFDSRGHTKDDPAVFFYLPRSIDAFYLPGEFMHILTEYGFSRVHADSLSLGVATLYRVTRHD
ncbi:MAG: hypothetical protein ABSA46_15290 [Thermodesulfovibrionales bacterium]